MRYVHIQTLPDLLERLELSVLLSTYQAGRVVSMDSHRGELRLGFSYFDQAFGLCRRASGIVMGMRDAIWNLPSNREIAPHIKPEGEYDIAFLACSCHHSCPLMGQDLAWGCERLWDSLCHIPQTEVLLESGSRNPCCWLETRLWRAGDAEPAGEGMEPRRLQKPSAGGVAAIQ